MVVKLILFLLCVLETLQHLSYPINFCNMASTCIHDSRVVCASSPDGCSRRSFLDQCDMYEYNCDYGTRYQETYILFCGTLLTSTQITKVSSNMTEDTTDTEINKSSIKKLTHTIPENVTSKSDTVPLTVSTSTPVITTINNNSKENDTNKSESVTTVNPTTYVYCCDRPLTWETTTELTKTYDITTDSHSDETKQTTETSTEYNVTDSVYNTTTNIHDNTITFITTSQQTSDTVDTTTLVNTETDKKESTIEIINQTTPKYCCDRPLTWETTSEVTKIYEDNTINHDSDENKQTTEASTEYNVTDTVYDETTNIYDIITITTINQKISDTVSLDDTTIFVNTETKEAPDKKQSDIDVNQTTTEYCCNRPFTWETTTEVNKIEDITNKTHHPEEEKLTATINENTDDYTEDTSTYSTTPPTLRTEKFHTEIHLSSPSKVSTKCPDKCQRPITWLTTRRGRKHYWN